MFNNILHPNRYHGLHAYAPYFEGWYYKLISADETRKFAIIPGVYISPQPENSHCFIQIFNSESGKTNYHRYAYNQFAASRDSFELQVGPNTFSADYINLNINDGANQIKGHLSFKGLNTWPVKFISPGAMGWFAWVPFMQTYHGVVSMDHAIEGTLQIDGIARNFTGGRGYIEKDWGKMFPSAYIWGQSNHFDHQGVSLMLSVALIPWLGFTFAGFIIGFLHGGHLYRFATYNRSKIDEISIDDTMIKIAVHNSSYRLRIRGFRSEGGFLQAPTAFEMDRRIIETLNAKLEVRLEGKSGKIIYEGTGRNAGFETVGELWQIQEMIQKK